MRRIHRRIGRQEYEVTQMPKCLNRGGAAMIQRQPSRLDPAIKVQGQFLAFMLVLCALLFLPAGTFAYGEG
jgi:hypothetical protein